ncbi:hypothetical protein ScalyP_jg2963 [Parmales sp. scaly parma]|nr:hypothetical protein ScalyP_jg2963 [Parmales sp. scaly parma]
MSNHEKTGGEALSDKQKVKLPNSENLGSITDLFQALKLRRKHRFLIFKLADNGDVLAEHIGAPQATAQEFIELLPDNDCRFAVYDHDSKTSDGRNKSKLFFFSWLPSNATPHKSMGYSAAKGVFRDKFTGVFDEMAKEVRDVEICLDLREDKVEEGSDSDFSDA